MIKAPDQWPAARVQAYQQELLTWFDANRRDLPWRKNRTAYRVWISELMLQQTRVDQVIPYYHRFMKRFPSLKALAESSIDDVLKAWEGLGYYSRARNLHKTAGLVHREYKGRFPRTVEGLKELPGIGDYSAAAIASLAFNVDAAVVDGNVIRVLARLQAWDKDSQNVQSKKKFVQWSAALLRHGEAGAYNEATMELGATVCTPKNPNCKACPVAKFCLGKKDPSLYPVKKKKAPVPTVRVGAAAIRNGRGQYLIAQRKPTGLLGGLWEFPGGKVEEGESLQACARREIQEELGIGIKVGEKRIVVHHTYSHFKLEMHVYNAVVEKGRPRCIDCAAFRWVYPRAFDDFAFSRADLYVTENILKAKKL